MRDSVRSVMRDVVTLEICGINPVVVHGGGKFITAAMEKAGLRAEFVDGQRVTDEASIQRVESTLNGEINPQLATMIGDMVALHRDSRPRRLSRSALRDAMPRATRSISGLSAGSAMFGPPWFAKLAGMKWSR